MKIDYKIISGIMTAILLLAGGTIYLEKTGDYHNCRAQWIENTNGTYTCPKDNYMSYCYEIEDRGSGWFRCWIGTPVIIPEKKINRGIWNCDSKHCCQGGICK